MSWFSDFVRDLGPIVPIAIAIVAPEIAPAIGGALGATGATAATVGNAVISGGLAAAQGGSAEDVLKSAAGSVVGGEIGKAVTGAPTFINEFTGDIITPATGAIGATGSEAVGRGLGAAAGGTASGLVRGQPLDKALMSGAISGLATGFFPSEGQGFERALTGTALSQLLSPSPKGGGVSPSATVGGATVGGATPSATQTGVTPGTQALGQALRTDMGAPIFGSSDKEGDKKRSGWNLESLRYMGGEA